MHCTADISKGLLQVTSAVEELRTSNAAIRASLTVTDSEEATSQSSTSVGDGANE